jgi:hypothetical protein
VVGRTVALLMILASCDGVLGLDERMPAELPFVCPAAFRSVAGSLYGRFDDLVTWHQAESACQALSEPESSGHVHLAVITSDAELAAIQADLTVDMFWIGHTDIALEGAYVPVTAEPVAWPPLTSPPWAGGQPNNLNGHQHCLIVDNQDFLDDKKCVSDTEMFRFVCECDLFESGAPLPP